MIRAYRYVYPCTGENGMASNPRYLWEDMFGYHSIGTQGINIKWVDDIEFSACEPRQCVRFHLNSKVDNKVVRDTKPWRFIKTFN